MDVGRAGFSLMQVLLLGGGLCVLVLALLVGLAIFARLLRVIRSLVGRLALAGCYLLVLLGCCLLLLGGVLALPGGR